MQKKKEILIIDDEQELCELIKEVLEQTDLYQVRWVGDGKTGLRKIQEDHPDLVLLDLVMPEMKGDYLLKKMQENANTKNIPVIIISGLGDVHLAPSWKKGQTFEERDQDIKESKLYPSLADVYGVKYYLPKPFGQRALVDLVEKIFNRQSSEAA